MFNLGPEKILVILAIALIVLGPDKLPEAARKAGQVLGHLRRLSGGFQNEIREAFDEPLQAFNREFSAGERGEQRAITTETTTETVATAAEEGDGAAEPEAEAAAGSSTEPAAEPAAEPSPPDPSPVTSANPAERDTPPAPPLPAWVFGRDGDHGSGPSFH